MSAAIRIFFIPVLGILSTPFLLAQEVRFDTPAIVIAQPINPAVVEQPTMGGRLLRLQIPISTFIEASFQGQISELTIELISPNQTLRVIDFWPRMETYSDIEGSVNVQTTQQQDRNLKVNLTAAYPPVTGSLAGDFQNKTQYQESFQRRPPMQVLLSSGISHRGYGVCFKFRPGTTPMLEGTHDIAILVEAAPQWRGDLIRFLARASGTGGKTHSRGSVLSQTDLWIATHLEGDHQACAEVRCYVTQEQRLRALAASQAGVVAEHALPTWWHRLGAAMEVVEPRIPDNYLGNALFGDPQQYFDHHTSRLPVDLRVAILDYWDQKKSVLGLALPNRTSTGLALASQLERPSKNSNASSLQ
ncbi:MAG: hypothetical protein KDB03_21810 [Planctomycetales bacterium]|nr:hypothetical protein [Planctomycetales bacterium]